MAHSSQQRNVASALARTDPAAGFSAALAIPDAWYSTQALSQVARFAPEPISGRALEQAKLRAGDGKDTYQRCAVLAWPLRAALELGRRGQAMIIAEEAARAFGSIEYHCSRAEAVALVLHAAFPDQELRWRVLEEMRATCQPDAHWRCLRLYRDAAQLIAAEGAKGARRFIEDMPPGKARDRMNRDLAAGRVSTPRPFFW